MLSDPFSRTIFRRSGTLFLAATALWLGLLSGCKEEQAPERPPVHSGEMRQHFEPVQIDVRTRIREIEMELERLEELQADEETARMVERHLVDDLKAGLASTRKLLETGEGRQSRRFQRFVEDANRELDALEQRIAKLKPVGPNKKPASNDAGSSDSR